MQINRGEAFFCPNVNNKVRFRQNPNQCYSCVVKVNSLLRNDSKSAINDHL